MTVMRLLRRVVVALVALVMTSACDSSRAVSSPSPVMPPTPEPLVVSAQATAPPFGTDVVDGVWLIYSYSVWNDKPGGIIVRKSLVRDDGEVVGIQEQYTRNSFMDVHDARIQINGWYRWAKGHNVSLRLTFGLFDSLAAMDEFVEYGVFPPTRPHGLKEAEERGVVRVLPPFDIPGSWWVPPEQ